MVKAVSENLLGFHGFASSGRQIIWRRSDFLNNEKSAGPLRAAMWRTGQLTP
jgi:hypothetical protein